MLAIAKVLVPEQPDRGLGRQHPALFLDDRPLERSLLPILADDLLEVVRVEDPAHHVLGARLLPLLHDHDVEARPGHRDRSADSGRSGADDDGVELLFVGHPRTSYPQ